MKRFTILSAIALIAFVGANAFGESEAKTFTY